MRGNTTLLSATGRSSLLLTLTVLLFAGLANKGRAAEYADLSVVKPISSCADLRKTNLSKVSDTPGEVTSVEVIDTDKGPFCKVTSHVAPSIVITTFLPAEHWTQRYFQGRGDDSAGKNGFSDADTCQPALTGEFAYGVSNAWFMMVIGDKDSSSDWEPNPQKIIDYAYRGNHVAVQVSKALMKAYYGKEPRYSYFVGCSDGGRQALIEAQRYPGDFDAVAAGSPGILTTAEESTFHLWNDRADSRQDGTNILMPEKLTLLHDAVVAHCDALSGVNDGLLEDPDACNFNPESMQCAPGQRRQSNCFTTEELTAIQKLYDGAHDDQGNYLYFGLERGSEELWPLPKTPTPDPADALNHALQLAYIILPEVTPALSDFNRVTFTKADFARASTRSPLFDAANTDLKAFAARGGKVILWHGLNDPQIPVGATIAYYQGVQKFIGKQATDRFMRMFLLPGVGHCGGGDGFTQFDVLSALMAWRESKRAPAEMVTGKTNEKQGLGSVLGTNLSPTAERPFATPQPTLIATRPVYPYPYVARYTGKGDSNNASSYSPVLSSAKTAQTFNYEALKLIGPDNQHNYQVKDGRLIIQNTR